jgi:8-oxo-dGTP pyrophosphatase MutT (NUDIX family)
VQQKDWVTVGSRVGYDHPFFKVREDHVILPNGHEITDFTIWENCDVAQVMAVTPDKKIILVRQFKQGAGKIVSECPGGFVDVGEDKMAAAHRELKEETGYTVKELILLGRFHHHPTKETSNAYFYLGLNAKSGKQKLDITEDIEVQLFSLSEVMSLIKEGEIVQTGTIAGIFLALEFLGKEYFD